MRPDKCLFALVALFASAFGVFASEPPAALFVEPPAAILAVPPAARVFEPVAAPVKFGPYDSCLGVWCRSGLASGTAVTGAPKGQTFVATAKHVTDAIGSTGRAVYWQGRSIPARLLATHPSADVALLVVDEDIPAVSIATPVVNSGVAIKAHGQNFSFSTPRKGRIMSAGRSVQLNLMCGPGDSGGGILNASGELVGVLSGGVPGQPVGFAVNASLIRDLTATAGVRANSPNDLTKPNLFAVPEPQLKVAAGNRVLVAHMAPGRPLPDADGLVYDASGAVVMSYTLDAAGVEITPEMTTQEQMIDSDGNAVTVSVVRWPGKAAGYTVVDGNAGKGR